MSHLVFIDTETTSLRYDRQAWEIALIVRDEHGDHEHQWFIDAEDLNLGEADLISLKIGRFYDRHPAVTGFGMVHRELDALREVEQLTRGAHLAGAVPNFDADVLATRMRWHKVCPSWHYHLIDIEALVAGYLAHKATTLDPHPGPLPLPWRSDDLSAAVGVKVREEDRHTALGDARWARDIYDAVTSPERAA